jgi:hypothetical protein
VTFSVSGAPPGVGITFDSGREFDPHTVTIDAAATVSPGSYAIAITGKAADRTDRTATLTLIVTATVPGGNTSVFFCGQRPLFFVFQDGDSDWAAVTGESGRYRFNILSGRGAFAAVLGYTYEGGAALFETHIYYGTQAELDAISPSCVVSSAGSVAGSIAKCGEDVKLAQGDYERVLSPATNFVLPSRSQPSDLVAWSSAVRGQLVNKVIIRRNEYLDAGAVMSVLDFNAAEAFAPVPRRLSFATAEVEYVGVDYHTANGADASLMCYSFSYNFEFCSVSSHDVYPGIPSPQNGDVHRFSLWAPDRSVTSCFKEAVDQTLVLPPRLGPIDVSTVAATPTQRFRTRYSRQPEYNGGVHVRYTNGQPTVTRDVQLNVSAGYLGTTAVVDLTIPDFGALSGWNPVWGLEANPVLTFEARGWTDIHTTDPNAAPCGGEGNAFDRIRPQSSRIQFAWTSPMVLSAVPLSSR